MNIDDIIIIKLIGAAGFWKLMELIFKNRAEKKKKNIEIDNLTAQTNNLIVENWIEWSAKLENRVKELESSLIELKQENEKKDSQIVELQEKVEILEQEKTSLLITNESLHKEIEELKSTKP